MRAQRTMLLTEITEKYKEKYKVFIDSIALTIYRGQCAGTAGNV
jgi:hypothetical protein